MNLEYLFNFVISVSEIGKNNKNLLPINEVEIFKYYFDEKNNLKTFELDIYDGKYTRREISTRYLLLNIVLDQGPDIVGVRELLKRVTNDLYRKEIRIFHKPIDFFRELNISIDELVEKNNSIKELRSKDWALENNTTPSKYTIFFAQSLRGLVSNKVLDYAIHRWGVPLSLFYLLEKDLEKRNIESKEPLVDYLESYPSAEIMTNNLKDHERYGLGNAIGDKACHLFAKFYISILSLVKRKDSGWSNISYELPFDSNAGRVLFRTGVLFELAGLKDYIKWEVVQRGKGKGGTNYIRVTNIRDKRIESPSISKEIFDDYIFFIKNYLKKNERPRGIEIQRIPNLIIYELFKQNKIYSIANFDDGLIYVGTKYCFNHDKPNCSECPIKDLCKGYKENKGLILNYRT